MAPPHTLFPRCQFQAGAQVGKQLTPFHAHGFRHGQHQVIPFGGAHIGQGQTGVAAGRFNNEGIPVDQAAFLRRRDQGQADPVLYAAHRIVELAFGQNFSPPGPFPSFPDAPAGFPRRHHKSYWRSFPLFLPVPFPIDQFRTLHHHPGIRRHRLGNPEIAADHGSGPDDRSTA